MSDDTLTPHLRDWKRREELAEALIPIIGTLYRNHSLVVAVFGHSLVGNSAVDASRSCSGTHSPGKPDLDPRRLSFAYERKEAMKKSPKLETACLDFRLTFRRVKPSVP